MLIELDRLAADASDPTDQQDIRALADLCRFVARECQRLNLEGAEHSALNLAAELTRSLKGRCH